MLQEKIEEQKSEDGIENFNIIVKIKDNLQKRPFIPGLQSINITAIILSYYGRKYTSCRLFQLLTHSSRAFIVSQKGLPGFLVHGQFDLIEEIEKAREMIKVINDRLKGKLTYGVSTTPTVQRLEVKYRGELNEQG